MHRFHYTRMYVKCWSRYIQYMCVCRSNVGFFIYFYSFCVHTYVGQIVAASYTALCCGFVCRLDVGLFLYICSSVTYSYVRQILVICIHVNMYVFTHKVIYICIHICILCRSNICYFICIYSSWISHIHTHAYIYIYICIYIYT